MDLELFPRTVFAILPPGSWSSPGHALQSLGTLEYRWFKGSLRYLQHINPTVWAARLQAFEQAANAAATAKPPKRGVIPDWRPITGKQTYSDSVMEVCTEVHNSRSLPSFGERGVEAAYNRVTRGAGVVIQYRITDASRHGGPDAGHQHVIKVWQQGEKTLTDHLTPQELQLGFAANGSCVAAKDLGVGDIADVLEALAPIFL